MNGEPLVSDGYNIYKYVYKVIERPTARYNYINPNTFK